MANMTVTAAISAVLLGSISSSGCTFDTSGLTPVSADAGDAAGAVDARSVGIVVDLQVAVRIDHGRVGNLILKVTGPGGTTMALMSRPGFLEDADDGSGNGVADQYDASGDQSDMDSAAPITFRDYSNNDAEQMGYDLTGVGTAVCANDAFCDYRPNRGAVSGPSTLAEAFAGESKTGAWRLCVADSHADTNPDGVLVGWDLVFATELGTEMTTQDGLSVAISDATYDGSIGSMNCTTMKVP